MNRKIHPALAEHAMEENEKLRGLLHRVIESGELTRPQHENLEADICFALSQQIEPVDAIPFAGFDPNFAPGSNPENPQTEPSEPAPAQTALVEALRRLTDAATPGVIDWVRCGLSANGRLVDGDHPALSELVAARRAALAAQGGDA